MCTATQKVSVGMYSGCDTLSLQILFVYFLTLPSLLHPSTRSAITAGFSQPPATMSFSAHHAEIDPMLHIISNSDSIPSVANSVPFHDPNFTPQAPFLSDFNPRIPSSFDFSNNDSTKSCQSFDNSHNFPFTDNSISAASMPTAGIHISNFDISSMLVNNDDSLAQQLIIIGEGSLIDVHLVSQVLVDSPSSIRFS